MTHSDERESLKEDRFVLRKTCDIPKWSLNPVFLFGYREYLN